MEVQANVENDSATCFIDDPASYYFKCSDLLISPSDAGDPFTGLINPNQDPAVIEQMRQAAGLNDPWYVSTSVGSEMLCKAILVKVSYTNALLLT